MRIFSILICAIVIIYGEVNAQSKLHYYLSGDSSLMGVKDEKGQIIIPAEFPNYGFVKNNELIVEPTIEFMVDKKRTNSTTKSGNALSPVMPIGAVYSREGKFLYHPQFFDNGMDYWEEGLRRYAENGKIGFADKLGKKITVAKWDFAGIFNYGYAEVLEGNLKRVYEEGGEHWTVGSEGKMSSYLVNRKGERVVGYTVKKHPKDYLYKGKYYPYPFVYNEAEKEILNALNGQIVGITLMFMSTYYQYAYKPLQLEITERPNSFLPYFTVSLYDEQQSNRNEEIYIHGKTKEAFIKEYEGSYTPLKKAIVHSLQRNLDRKDDYFNSKTKELIEKTLKTLKSQP